MFKGIIPPIITPFKADFSVDQSGYADVIEYMIDGGVHAIIVGGTTGEFYAMSEAERVQQFRFAKSVINGRVPMICGVNALTTSGACDLAVAAHDAGADGLLLAAPPYSLPTEDELAQHCMMIDTAANLPIMLYNYPGRTGVNMGTDFLNQVSQKPNFQCIKEASGDINRLHLLVQQFPNIALSCGAEDQALEFFVWGSTSWVTPMGNFIIKEVVSFYNACSQDRDFDKARQMMHALLPLTSVIESGGKFAQTVKFAAVQQGLPAGPVRPPMQAMSEEFEQNFKAVLITAQNTLRNIMSS
ncbi:MAG: dihydrodipicolinate synthase family protein [Arenicellales bacterium WSBS_2016_MAG_OTU3]